MKNQNEYEEKNRCYRIPFKLQFINLQAINGVANSTPDDESIALTSAMSAPYVSLCVIWITIGMHFWKIINLHWHVLAIEKKFNFIHSLGFDRERERKKREREHRNDTNATQSYGWCICTAEWWSVVRRRIFVRATYTHTITKPIKL